MANVQRRVVCALLTVSAAFGCTQNNSETKDAATTSSYKTGFFKPALKQEYSIRFSSKAAPVTPTQFVLKVRSLLNSQKLAFSKQPNDEYAVSATADGEQVLILFQKGAEPFPIMSYTTDGKVYSWSVYTPGTQAGHLVLTEIFIKRPYADRDKPLALDVNFMYVRHKLLNNDSDKETIIVPWLKHLESETAKLTTYKVGNSIYEAQSGLPLVEFRKVGKGPAWVVVGPYKDADVVGGTVFWKVNDTDYLSMTKGAKDATRWKVQDKDSLDRLDRVAATSVKVPAEVKGFLDTLPAPTAAGAPGKVIPVGFDWFEGDNDVIQVNRNNQTYSNLSEVLGITLTDEIQEEQANFEEADYEPKLGLDGGFFGFFGSSNTPVQIGKSNNNGVDFQTAQWTDQTGVKRAGVNLGVESDPIDRSKNLYRVLNQTDRTVSTVRADGSVVGSPVPYSDYQRRLVGQKQTYEAMVDNGDLSRSAADAQKLAAANQQRFAKQDALLDKEVGKDTADGFKQFGGRLALATGSDLAKQAKITGTSDSKLEKGAESATIDAQGKALITGKEPTARDLTRGTITETLKNQVDSKAPGAAFVKQAITVTSKGADTYANGDYSDSSNPDADLERRLFLTRDVAGGFVTTAATELVKGGPTAGGGGTLTGRGPIPGFAGPDTKKGFKPYDTVAAGVKEELSTLYTTAGATQRVERQNEITQDTGQRLDSVSNNYARGTYADEQMRSVDKLNGAFPDLNSSAPAKPTVEASTFTPPPAVGTPAVAPATTPAAAPGPAPEAAPGTVEPSEE